MRTSFVYLLLCAGLAKSSFANEKLPGPLLEGLGELHHPVTTKSKQAQRYFDQELDGLGFQVKEWPWLASRDSFMADLVFGRKIACDRDFKDCKNVGGYFEKERRILSAYEQDDFQKLSGLAVHAVEATCRNLQLGDSEDEVAGQLAHRLLKHGVEAVSLHIAADGRSRRYCRSAPTAAKVQQYCVVQATGRQAGLVATASRSLEATPTSTISAPRASVAARLMAGAFDGMTITALAPTDRAAYATPWAWLPLE